MDGDKKSTYNEGVEEAQKPIKTILAEAEEQRAQVREEAREHAVEASRKHVASRL